MGDGTIVGAGEGTDLNAYKGGVLDLSGGTAGYAHYFKSAVEGKTVAVDGDTLVLN